MYIFKIEQNNRLVGYVKDYLVAQESIRITWSGYNPRIVPLPGSFVVKRDGFDDIKYDLIPVRVFMTPEHL